MMRDRTRRTEAGKMFIDVAKYVFTIVVIGGLVSERVNVGNIVLGILIAVGTGIVGFCVIPQAPGGGEPVNNFEIALVGVGIGVLALFAYVMMVSHWHDRKRHAH